MSFNSLQTGKRIASQRLHARFFADQCEVSIPFKRESGSQVRSSAVKSLKLVVSIPFKRESGSQVNDGVVCRTQVLEFQFPSNGKTYHKAVWATIFAITGMFQFPSNGKTHSKQRRKPQGKPMPLVSIPFKRENAFQVHMRKLEALDKALLVSIPFKREGGYKDNLMS